jgi:hypothetical protein
VGVGIGSVYYFPTGYFIASGTGEDNSKVFERNPVGTWRYIGFNCSG